MRSLLGRFHRPFARGTEEQLLMLNNLGDGSTLSLDFTTGVLDPRLTFTRLSNATFINSSGLVQWAAANEFRNTGWVTSTTPTGWNVTLGTGTTTWNNDGTLTMNTGGSSTRPFINADQFTVSQGIAYTFGYTVVSASGSPQISSVISSTVAGETFAINGATVGPTTVVQAGDVVSCTFTPTGTTAIPRMGPGVNTGMTNTAMTITRPQMNPGVRLQSYLANSSTTAANNNTPRFDYDPTAIGTPRGLLIEGAATNLVLNGSMAYTATAPTSWVRGFSGCTVASVDSTTFLGQKAWSIAATASGQRDLLEQVISLAANTTYTVSVYLEAVTGTPATFAYMTSLPAGATSGTVVNPSAGRVSFTVTVGATAGNGTLRIGIGSASGTGVSADASVRFSHVQVELGSGASSYIPTGASTGNRQADVCYMDGTNFSSWYNASTQTGTLFADITHSALSTPNVGIELGAGLGNQSALNRVSLRRDAVIVDGVAALAVSPTGASQRFKTAIAFAPGTGNTTACRNGGTVSNPAQAAGTLSGINALKLYVDSTLYPYGWIRQVKVWPTNLPNATLQSITTI